MFRTSIGKNIFERKYKHEGCENWEKLCRTMVYNVCKHPIMSRDEKEMLVSIFTNMFAIPGGRYLYYANREAKFWNNCYVLFAEEDSREDWANLSWKAQSCLMTGGGIGIDYSIYREENAKLKRTGGVASGPIKAMKINNEIGRYVAQGGSRRSALYASLHWKHPDIKQFLTVKDWDTKIQGINKTYAEMKSLDFNFACPLDCTNISINYDDEWLQKYNDGNNLAREIFHKNVYQAMKTGEPGFSFNFGDKQKETGRNACTELTSADDSDICNLLSINLSRITTLQQFIEVIELCIKFQLMATLC